MKKKSKHLKVLHLKNKWTSITPIDDGHPVGVVENQLELGVARIRGAVGRNDQVQVDPSEPDFWPDSIFQLHFVEGADPDQLPEFPLDLGCVRVSESQVNQREIVP